MLWQSPLSLWLLCALTIPLLIHLLRRDAAREITFAAAHWLQKKHQHRKRLLLRDRWLMLLRMLLLAILALLLAQPLLQRQGTASMDLLLVDPAIERAQLNSFLRQNPSLSPVLWLQPQPVPIEEPPPLAQNLWHTLSALAGDGEFRRAHILLRSAENPSGHSALRISPHWQWHTLEKPGREDSSPLPKLALLGEGPPWLEAALTQLQANAAPQLALQKLDTSAALDAKAQDWLIYDSPGALPTELYRFVQKGGLLITDQRVQPASEIPFVKASASEPLQAAALGRGSWLRYGRDWHSAEFFQRIDLPHILWQQWYTQDWALQSRSRGHWSSTRPAGIAVAETQVRPPRPGNFDSWLLLAFVLLLALERMVALARPVTGADSRD